MAITAQNSGWEMDQRPVDVVVISSQLAYGAVGNTATARVLTEARYRCVQVPTVILGNLPHYPTVHGGALPDDWLAGILSDLLTLGVLSEVKYVLVGYLAHPEQAGIIAEWFTALQHGVGNVDLIVDPAMGDDDVGLYTDPAVAAAYAQHLVPLATGLTPNRFELSLLANRELNDQADISAAAQAMRPEAGWIVVTSSITADERAGPDTQIANAVADRTGTMQLRHQHFPTSAKGAGDIFAATIIARLLEGESIDQAAQFAGATVADSIEHTEKNRL